MGLRLSTRRYEFIKHKVIEMYVKAGVRALPIDVFEIARKLCVTVHPYSDYSEDTQDLLMKKSSDGFSLLHEDLGWHIYFNDQKNDGRIRNTIMHELGHIILDHSQESELAETEVNFFAKYALSPPVLIHQVLRNQVLGSDSEIIKTIIRIFKISRQAAIYAYSYYRKWQKQFHNHYTEYEYQTLTLFC